MRICPRDWAKGMVTGIEQQWMTHLYGDNQARYGVCKVNKDFPTSNVNCALILFLGENNSIQPSHWHENLPGVNIRIFLKKVWGKKQPPWHICWDPLWTCPSCGTWTFHSPSSGTGCFCPSSGMGTKNDTRFQNWVVWGPIPELGVHCQNWPMTLVPPWLPFQH